MSIKNAKKLGFWSSLAMLVGTVIGIGIFFKNGSVSRAVSGNGATWLMAWIAGGILSLSAAVSFSEIGSMKTGKISGLGGWMEQTAGKKMGYFTRFNYVFFYFGFYVPVFGIFVSEAFFQMIIQSGGMKTQPDVWVHILVGLSITLLCVGTRFISIHASGIVQKITTGLKVLPLIIAVIIGIAFAASPQGAEATGVTSFSKGNFSFVALIAALPAVLFAYDSFLNVAALSHKTKGGTKTVSKVVLFGLIGITIIYTLIGLVSIIHNSGTIDGVLINALPASSAKGISIIIWLFIAISAYGVNNGMASIFITQLEQIIDTNSIFGSKTLKKKFGIRKTIVIFSSIIFSFWFLVYAIPSLALNSDRLIDGMTNYGTLFFFGMYAISIITYMRKRSKITTTKKINSLLFNIVGIIAIVGITTLLGFQFFGTQTMEAWKNPTSELGWGFLAPGKDVVITKIQGFAVFSVFSTIFLTFPWINRILTKKFENFDPVHDTQTIKEIKIKK